MATQLQWAWLAGLVDGEGCIHINRHRATYRNDLRNDSFRLYVQMTMGDKPVLERCKRLTGLGTVQPHTVSNKRANAAWCWMTSAGDARVILEHLLPYLIVKREEAKLAMLFAQLKPWRPGGRGGATAMPQRLADARTRRYWQLRMLKSRWRFYRQQLTRADRAEIRRLGLTV